MTEETGPTLTALSEMRHQCGACGHCCHGHRVSLEDEDEIALVNAQGEELGVPEPVVDGAMRTEGGGCVFLDPDKLCRIHKTWGIAAKPRVCQQYPFRVARTEEGFRGGIDPGCTNNWATWRTGPLVRVAPLMKPHDKTRPPDEADTEDHLLELASKPDATLAVMLRRMAEGAGAELTSPGEDLPDGFAARLATRLQAANIGKFLGFEAVGNGIRECLGHMPAFVATLESDGPPSWPGRLDPESEAFALEVLRRHLFLRLGDDMLPTAGQAAVLLAGAVACAWADPRPEVFGPALSSWDKSMRHRGFWAKLVPNHETLVWLISGVRPTRPPPPAEG